AVRHQGICSRDPWWHHVGLGGHAGRIGLRLNRSACYRLLRLDLYANRGVFVRHPRTRDHAQRPVRARGGVQGLTVSPDKLRAAAMPFSILSFTVLAVVYAAIADGYAPFILALVALTTVVGVGLNI